MVTIIFLKRDGFSLQERNASPASLRGTTELTASSTGNNPPSRNLITASKSSGWAFRAENIQLLQYEQSGFITDRFLCVPDVDHSPGECHLFDRRPKCRCGANRFDRNIRSPAVGHFQQSLM